jgi:hypothetical protein
MLRKGMLGAETQCSSFLLEHPFFFGYRLRE